MRKIIIPIIIVCLACLICFTGCNYSTNSNVDTIKKHTVELSLDNYLDYLTIETTSSAGNVASSTCHNFRGALAYAYYDNVIITYELTSSSSSSTTTTTKTLKLNVGGCGTINTYGSMYGSSSYEITAVSGTLTYWF